jgi:hypothetical protein
VRAQGIDRHGERDVAAKCDCISWTYSNPRKAEPSKTLGADETAAKRPHCAFAQILGKFYFFDLGENLRRILLDYGQKRLGTTNAAFKASC